MADKSMSIKIDIVELNSNGSQIQVIAVASSKDARERAKRPHTG